MNYTLSTQDDGTSVLEVFTVNPDGSTTPITAQKLTAGETAFLASGLAAVTAANND